jgi:hypothetical protein
MSHNPSAEPSKQKASQENTGQSTTTDSSPNGTTSWLYRGIAISSQFYRNNLSLMNLCPTREPGTHEQKPGVVHRHLGWVDALTLLMLVCTMIAYFSLSPILRSVTKPLEIQLTDVHDLPAIAKHLEKTDDSFLAIITSQIPFQFRFSKLADEQISSKQESIEYLSAINEILRTPSLMPSDKEIRYTTDTSLLESLVDSFPASRDTPFLRLAIQRNIFQSHFSTNIKEIQTNTTLKYLNLVRNFRIYILAITIYAIYRWLDIAILAITNSPIGLSSVSPGKRTDEQNKRLILLSFLHLIELTFCTSIILFFFEQTGMMRFKESFTANSTIEYAPAHALQTAFSTLSTIGYGTYAPNCSFSCLFCFTSAITAVLLLSFVATSAYSVASSTSEPPDFAKYLTYPNQFKYFAGISIAISLVSLTLYFVAQYTIPWYLFR